MKKLSALIIANLLIFLTLIFAAELFVWGCENIRIKIHKESHFAQLPIPFHKGIVKNVLVNLENFKNPKSEYTRHLEGTNYTKKPIVIFGCSFAYGFELKNEQTFSYKLSHLTKRPVYNRAFPGWGIQHMLNQVRQTAFYNDVPEPEYAIFIMIKDHFRRLYTPSFMSAHLLGGIFNLRYEYKNNELEEKYPKGRLQEIFQSSYIVQKAEQFYINNILLNERNCENYLTFAIEHFIESKQAMQKHWKNTKYVVILYQGFKNDELFKQILEDNGFIVISVPNDYYINTRDEKYESDTFHPKEEAWNILTPKIAETLNL